MKKFLLTLLAALMLTSCSQEEQIPPGKSTPSAPTPTREATPIPPEEQPDTTGSKLTVKSNGVEITPKSFYVWAVKWSGNGWLDADSFYTIITSFDDIRSMSPSIVLGDDIEALCDVDFSFCIGEDIADLGTNWEESENFTYQRFSGLSAGTYYVKLNATFLGDYIPEGEGHDKTNFDFYFILNIL